MSSVDKQTPLDKETSSLATKIRALVDKYADGSFSSAEFLDWTITYGNRATAILHPNATTPPTEEQLEDGYKRFRQFANCQRVVDFCHKHNLVLDKSSHWWYLSDESPGHIVGLESDEERISSRGIARITNGIDLWIERVDGTLFKGHKEWWKKDKKPSQADKKPSAKKPKKPRVVLEEFDL